MPDKPRLLDLVRDRIRVKHYSLRTEQAYIQWIKWFIFFHHGKRHPKDMGAPEVEAFLSHWAAYSTPFGHAFHYDSATQSRGIRPGGRSEATLGF
jgi:hypothetical protein